jgi:hypothetical protein
MRWAIVFSVLVTAGHQEKNFGTPYIVKVQAKTRFSTSFKKADFDKEMKKNDDSLREKGREPVPNDAAGWDEWTFEASEVWKFDIDLFQEIFGKHITLRRYDIAIRGVVTQDARRNFWIEHNRSGTKMRLANRPKLPKDKVDPPDIRSKLAAAFKEGKTKFDVSGEIVRDPTNVILLASAVPVVEKEEK